MFELVIFKEPDNNIDLNEFCAVINVADAPCSLFQSPVPYYWFPINEVANWGYEPFFGTIQVVNYYRLTLSKKPILIHCHAGCARSPTVAYALKQAYYYSGVELDVYWYKRIFGQNDDKKLLETFEDYVKRECVPPRVIPFLIETIKRPDKTLISLLNETGLLTAVMTKQQQEKGKVVR